MLTRKQFRALLLDALGILLLSVAVIMFGMLASKERRNQREQRAYLSLFREVLPASEYEKVETDIIQKYSEINSVYKAVDSDNQPLGYILDVNMVYERGDNLHSLIAVSSDGSKLVGYKLIDTDENSILYSENEMQLLLNQTINKPIPMAVRGDDNTETVIDDNSQVVSVYGLNDGVYYAQSFKKDKSGFIDFVEIEVENGVITRVKWDAFNVDRTTKDRSEASLTGAYNISGENWATQSYNICHALIDYQNPDKIAMKSDGTTDIVAGVTCNIRRFVNLANECLNNSRHRFDETAYINTMMEILDNQYSGFKDTCTLTEEGYIVYSFDDLSPLTYEGGTYNSIYEAYIRQPSEEESSEDNPDSVTPTPIPTVTDIPSDNYYYEVGEDGVVRDAQNPVLTQSVDGLAMSEISTMIEGIPGEYERSAEYISGINVTYKFLREFFNWMS